MQSGAKTRVPYAPRALEEDTVTHLDTAKRTVRVALQTTIAQNSQV